MEIPMVVCNLYISMLTHKKKEKKKRNTCCIASISGSHCRGWCPPCPLTQRRAKMMTSYTNSTWFPATIEASSTNGKLEFTLLPRRKTQRHSTTTLACSSSPTQAKNVALRLKSIPKSGETKRFIGLKIHEDDNMLIS